MVSQDIKGIKEANLKLKQVLLRLDLDVPVGKLKVKSEKLKVTDATRLEETLPTTKWLLESGAKVTAIGHLGRPEAIIPKNYINYINYSNYTKQILNSKWQSGNQYSLEPIYEWFQEKLGNNSSFTMLENLRFDAGEEGNSLEFSKTLAAETGAEIYVFEAFAVSHREHASVTQIPRLFPTYTGMRFEKEIENLNKVLKDYSIKGLAETAQKRVLVVGGAKGETKIPLLDKLADKFDVILVGGRMPIEIANHKSQITNKLQAPNVKLAELQPDGLDITPEAAEEFRQIILNADVVVWNGPMGAYESAKFQITNDKLQIDSQTEIKNTPAWGTYLVAKAVSETKAFTVAGGGDTEAALTKFNLEKGIDWISSGGGAMLTYLAEGTVAFLETIKQNPK